MDLIRRLLEPDASFRLGNLAGGMHDVVLHRWFTNASFDWLALHQKRMEAPYVPTLKNPFDSSYYDVYPEQGSVNATTFCLDFVC
jgi:hypothetical protein